MASLADVTITLGLDDKGLVSGVQKANQHISSLKQSADSSASSLSSLEKGFGALTAGIAAFGAAISIKALADFSDSVTSITNRMATLSKSTEEANAQFMAVSAVAITSRSSLESVSQLYFRISNAANKLGISQKDALDVTEMLAKATQVYGTTNAEAAGALIQFSQALQSGRVQGDELRSMMENLPMLADALAKRFGVSTMAIKQMGADGKITARDLIAVSKDLKPQIDAMFASMKPTLSGSFEGIVTASKMAFKEFEDNTGTGQQFANVLEYIGFSIYKASKSIDSFVESAKPLITVIEIVGSLFLAGKIIKGLTFFGEILLKTWGVLTEFGGVIASVFSVIGEAGSTAWRAITSLAAGFKMSMEAGQGLWKSLGLVGKMVLFLAGTFTDAIMAPLEGTAHLFIALADGISYTVAALYSFLKIDAVVEWFKNIGKEGTQSAEELKNYRLEMEKFKTELSDKKGTGEFDNTPFEKALKTAQDTNKDKIASLKLDNELIGASQEYAAQRKALADIDKSYSKQLDDINEKLVLARKNNDTTAIDGLIKAQTALNNAKSEEKSTIEELLSAGEEKQLLSRLQNNADQIYITNQKTLRDLSNQQANIFLPAIQQEYRNIEQAADDAYQAMLQTEKVHWMGQKVENIPDSVKKELFDLTHMNVQAEKDKKTSIEETNNAKKYTTLLSQSQLEFDKQLSDIQQELAYTTMPEYQKIGEKIRYDADQRVKTAIKEIEISRGYAVSASERIQLEETIKGRMEEVIARQQESYNVSRQWDTGWTIAMNNYIQNATNAASIAESVFSKAMSGLEDVFVKFTQTGKFEWKSFVNSMIEELLRAQFKQTFASLFGGLFGASSKGSGTGGGLFAGLFAEGGDIPTGKWGIVGEAGPEIVQGPASVTPAKKLGAVQNHVTYNINAIDSVSFKQMISADPTFMFAVSEQGRRRLAGAR